MSSLPAPTGPVDSAVYVARAGRISYGVSIGVLCLECAIPFIAGDVGNATSYEYPVSFQEVRGATCDAVINQRDPGLLSSFIDAARELERQGVRAITGNCGYMATYQPGVAAAVDVPVLLSSLMQIPLVLRMLRPNQRLAVLCANQESFAESLLDAVGVSREERERLVVRGLQEQPCWREAIVEESGRLDPCRIEAEVVETAKRVRAEHPGLGGYLLECSDLPPYSRAVQAATGLPVFDWIGFIDYVHHAVVCRSYEGFL